MESSVIKGEVKKLKNPKLEAIYSIIKTLKTGCIVCMMYYGYTKWEKRSERKKLVTKKVETDGNYKFGNNFWYSYTGYLNFLSFSGFYEFWKNAHLCQYNQQKEVKLSRKLTISVRRFKIK